MQTFLNINLLMLMLRSAHTKNSPFRVEVYLATKNHILSRLTLIIWFTAVAVLFSGRAGDVASYSSSFSSLFPLSLRVSSLVTLRPSVARGLFAPWFNTPELLIGMDAIGTTYEIGMASENDGKNKFRNLTTKALSRKTNK